MRFHFYKIYIESKYYYRVLNNLNGIKIYNLKTEDEIFSFEVSFIDISALKNMLIEKDIKILKEKEYGFYKFIVNKKIIKAVSFISVFFVILLFINSLFIWNITVNGNYSNSDSEIIKFVNNYVSLGQLKNNINNKNIEEGLRNNFENISWVCVEIKGTNLIVHIREIYISEIAKLEDKPYNIIANKDGVIDTIITRNGKPMVKVGDSVKKGDVLISGKIEVNTEYDEYLFTNFYSADGTILAITNYQLEEKLNKEFKQKNIESSYNIYLPIVNNFTWNLSSKTKEVYKENNNFKLFGDFYLPIGYEKYSFEKVSYNKMTYSKEQAEKILNNKILYKLSKMEQKGYKILKNNVRIVDSKDCYILQCNLRCIEPIGKVQYIDVEKELQEVTTEANERY